MQPPAWSLAKPAPHEDGGTPGGAQLPSSFFVSSIAHVTVVAGGDALSDDVHADTSAEVADMANTASARRDRDEAQHLTMPS